MAWPKTLTAEEILGMKAEDLKARLEGAASKEDLTALTKANEELKGALGQIQESLKALTRQPDPPPPPADDTDPAVKMLADPKKFISDETAQLRQIQLENKAALLEMTARQNPEYSGVFRQYGTEIAALVAKVPLETRALPNFWQSSLRTFIGDKFIKGEIRQNNFPSLLGTSSVVRGADGEVDDPNFGFDPQMAEFFKGRGKNLKDMAFLRDRMVRDGDTLTEGAWKGRPH